MKSSQLKNSTTSAHSNVQAADNPVFKYTGDLQLPFIEPNSVIEITDGNLIVEGNIGDGARIKMISTHPPRPQASIAQGLISFSDININSIALGDRSVTHLVANGIRTMTSCNMSIHMGSQEIMSGNVNINNRIFTEGPLVSLGREKYVIVANEQTTMFDTQRNNTDVSATIDGRQYMGRRIEIDKNEVKVFDKNNRLISNEKATAHAETAAAHISDCSITVQGSIGHNVSIESFGNAIIRGDIGSFCSIISETGKLEAANVGEETILTAAQSIRATATGRASKLTSNQSSIRVDYLGESGEIKSNNDIEIGQSGDLCKITTTYGQLTARRIGQRNNVSVNKDIIAQEYIGDNTRLSSTYGGLQAIKIGKFVNASINKDISVDEVEFRSRLISTYGSLTGGVIGDNVHLIINRDARVSQIGNNSEVSSTYGGISVTEQINQRVTLNSNRDCSCNRIGDDCNVSSAYGSVTATVVGNNSSVSANRDVYISQYASASSRLISAYGRVRRPQNNSNTPVSNSGASTSSNFGLRTHGFLASNTTSSISTPAVATSSSNQHPRNEISKTLERFLTSFSENEEEFSTVCARLGINAEENECMCPITLDVPNKPVRVNGILFDYSSLVNLPVKSDGTREEPTTRDPFYLDQVQPDRDCKIKIERLIEQFKLRSTKGI